MVEEELSFIRLWIRNEKNPRKNSLKNFFAKDVLIFWSRLKMMPFFWNVSLLVTRRVFEYDPKPEHVVAHSKTPRPKKAWMKKLKIICTLFCFFYIQEVVHIEFVPNTNGVLEKLRKRDSFMRSNIIFHHYTPCHKKFN